jgi:hypothetical protein
MSKAITQKQPAKRRSWAIRLVNVIGAVIVTLVIMWQTGLTSRQWWDWAKTPKPAPIALAPVQPPTNAIGIAPPTPKGNDTSGSPIPLQLILVQTHPGMNVHEGTAQMGTVRESPQTYQAGALLENGARVAEIHTDYVLLQKGTRSVRLYLDNTPAAQKATGNALAMVGPIPGLPPPTKAPSREVVTDYIRPSPLYDGEALLGYQVYPGAKSAPFMQMGLRAGDVIVAIDSMPLTDPAAAWDMFRQLADGSIHGASIKRSGQVQELSLDGKYIANTEEAPAPQPVQAMLTPPPP